MRKVALWWMWPLPLTTRSDFWVGRVGRGPLQVECRLSVFVSPTRQICEGQLCFTQKIRWCRSETPSSGRFFFFRLIPGSHRYDSGLHWRLTSTEASAFEEPLMRCWGKRKGLSPCFCCWKMVTNASIQRFWVETMWWEFGCQGYEEIQVC